MSPYVVVHDGETATTLGSEYDLGVVVSRRRVSHIWPKSLVLRLVFMMIRLVAGDEGVLAHWTRRWRCQWTVRWVEAPHVVVYESRRRDECIRWEISQARVRLL